MAKTVTLHCEIGNHNWRRKRQRGRVPKNCPKHMPVKEVKPAGPETLICEFGEGHEWQRERKQGKRPKMCPEHRAQVAEQNGASTRKNTGRNEKTAAQIWAKLEQTPGFSKCRCELRPDMSRIELIELGSGCQTHYICPILDNYRRLVG